MRKGEEEERMNWEEKDEMEKRRRRTERGKYV